MDNGTHIQAVMPEQGRVEHHVHDDSVNRMARSLSHSTIEVEA